ncbi:MAG TPA: glycosyltransferase [Cytophagales bacterium]|nr:glycosyltransferase [Cytophagales bacterium]
MRANKFAEKVNFEKYLSELNLNRLILFYKIPVLGKVKTRLASSFGDIKAKEIYQKLLNHAIDVMKKQKVAIPYWYINEKTKSMTEDMFIQKGLSIGERMKNAIAEQLDSGGKKVALFGSDCYGINKEIIEEAFHALDKYDIVLGPANDGGYYSIGMKRMQRFLFEGITWSTPEVKDQTIEKCHQHNLSVYELPLLTDVDTPEDLEAYPELLNQI